MLNRVLSSRLILVTGKGGVGKTNISCAIGDILSQPNSSVGKHSGYNNEKRTLIVEVDNFAPSLESIYGVKQTYEPTQVKKNLFICNITWKEALHDWLLSTIKIKKIVEKIESNKVAMIYLDATPGAREIVILSRIAQYLESFDTVVVDLPASGHALGILRVPKTAINLMKSGPVHDKAKQLLNMFSDVRTMPLIVSLPETMVVNETIELWEKLHNDLPELQKPSVILNRTSIPSISQEEIELLKALEECEDIDQDGRNFLLAGRWEQDLEQATQTSLQRCQEAFDGEVASLPRFGMLGGYGAQNRGQKNTSQTKIKIPIKESDSSSNHDNFHQKYKRAENTRLVIQQMSTGLQRLLFTK